MEYTETTHVDVPLRFRSMEPEEPSNPLCHQLLLSIPNVPRTLSLVALCCMALRCKLLCNVDYTLEPIPPDHISCRQSIHTTDLSRDGKEPEYVIAKSVASNDAEGFRDSRTHVHSTYSSEIGAWSARHD